MPNSYWEFSAENNIYLQMVIDRPTFCCCIYRTDVYKKVNYEFEKYGKLHDIVFMMEIGQYGDMSFLHGECVRWRQHVGSDSNNLKTGPFPNELIEVIAKMKSIYHDELKINSRIKCCIKTIIFYTALYNFSYFLYNWSDLKRYISWDDFKNMMLKHNIFNNNHYKAFSLIIDSILNPAIRRESIRQRKKCIRYYSYRFGA